MLSASDPVRLALEQRVQFEALIADLSAHFVNLDATMVDGAIEDALQRIGELLDVDRAALTQLADNDRTLVFTHTWSRSRGQEPPLLRVDAERVMPFGLAVLLRQEVHAISSLAELPFDSPDREFLAQRHTKSAIAVPLVAAGRVIGTLGFATSREERHWDADLVRRLRLVTDVFASALARKRADAELRKAVGDRLEFETLIADLTSRFVNLDSDLVDGVIEDAQRRLVEALDIDRSALFEFDVEGNPLFTHVWARPEFAPMRIDTGSVAARFPWMSARLRQGEVVCLSSVRDLPADVPDRVNLVEVGTKANVSIPLIVSGRVIGALTFAAIREERAWPPDLVHRLALIGQVFASALARKRAELELRRTLDENARLRDRLIRENVFPERSQAPGGIARGNGAERGDSQRAR